MLSICPAYNASLSCYMLAGASQLITNVFTTPANNCTYVNLSYHIIYHYHYRYHYLSHRIVDVKRQKRLKVGTDKPKLKVKMQSVSDDDARKRLLGKPPRFEQTAGRSRSLGQQPGKLGYRRLIA